MKYLWSGMILMGIVYGILTGNLDKVTEAAVSSSKEAVILCISIAGITAMWSGIMKIGENAGMVSALAGRMRPVLRFLFPELDPDSMAAHYISLNFMSNIFGLGAAATPAGLMAMEELAGIQEQRKKQGKTVFPDTASNEMCTFLIINISSLQLIPVNIIAYRTQYGSTDPTAVVGPGIFATLVSTGVAMMFCKWMEWKNRKLFIKNHHKISKKFDKIMTK